MKNNVNQYKAMNRKRPVNFENDPRKLYFMRKKERQEKRKAMIKGGAIVTLIILSFFVIIYRDILQDKIFMGVSENKRLMEEAQKENAQLSYGLRNTMSLTAIKEEAQNNLGMRKISPQQITKVHTNREDFVEKVQGSTIKTDEKNLFEKIFFKIMSVL